jgi:hypothetical protein
MKTEKNQAKHEIFDLVKQYFNTKNEECQDFLNTQIRFRAKIEN